MPLMNRGPARGATYQSHGRTIGPIFKQELVLMVHSQRVTTMEELK